MMGHKICFCVEIWLIISIILVTPSYLEHWVRIDYGQQLIRHNTRHWSHEQLGMRLFLFVSTVGQGPTALAVGVGGGYLDIFTLIYPFSPLSSSLWDTA